MPVREVTLAGAPASAFAGSKAIASRNPKRVVIIVLRKRRGSGWAGLEEEQVEEGVRVLVLVLVRVPVLVLDEVCRLDEGEGEVDEEANGDMEAACAWGEEDADVRVVCVSNQAGQTVKSS